MTEDRRHVCQDLAEAARLPPGAGPLAQRPCVSKQHMTAHIVPAAHVCTCIQGCTHPACIDTSPGGQSCSRVDTLSEHTVTEILDSLDSRPIWMRLRRGPDDRPRIPTVNEAWHALVSRRSFPGVAHRFPLSFFTHRFPGVPLLFFVILDGASCAKRVPVSPLHNAVSRILVLKHGSRLLPPRWTINAQVGRGRPPRSKKSQAAEA